MLLSRLVLGLLLTFPVGISAQQTARRDAQAVVVLQQSLAAMGGTVPPDSIATGTVSVEAGGATDTGTVRILSRGFDQTVEQIRLSNENRTIIYSGGFAKEQGRRTRELPMELAGTSQSSAIPALLIAAALMDPDTTIEYQGIENISNQRAHRIKFSKTFSVKPRLQHLAEFTRRDIWISAQSGLPLRLSYEQREGGGAANRLHVDVSYSDYRNVSGTLFPYRIETAINGTTWQTFTFDRVTVGNGLSDLDFPAR